MSIPPKTFRRGLRLILALMTILGIARLCHAQLPAFPGAEGAAKYVTGGRGGDVYRVTNLNDSGAGSLRAGIDSAPTTGRTIVFDVAGAINLNSSLNVGGKNNLTIAGQTAPGGGIALQGDGIRVDNSHDVVLQFLRVRPGKNADNTDGLWVSGSSNVMVDHLTTAWSTDESLSVTHDSDQVTVQWSTMLQGLLGHSFGSLINGGSYTYHHNLYAHNRSRNPRPQQSGGFLTLDFVNNVIYNPGDRFGYSGGDAYNMNMVGNYGLKGPNSQDSSPANYLMRPSSDDSRFYVEGNKIDLVRNGEVDGVAVEGHAAFRPGDDYTIVGSRFDAGGVLPEVTTHTADQAYVHALSRAGAVNFRDGHDRDMIRSIFNQQPGHITHESEWGANPSVPAGTARQDTNGDGVPDSWAADNGFDVHEPLHQTFAPGGYTYLEEYIHSLTPFAYPPTETTEHTIPTSHGMGADAQVSEIGSASTGDGLGSSINLGWGGNANKAMLLRFDLSEIQPGSVESARLELTAASDFPTTHEFKVYGLEHDARGWDWDEADVEFDGAPGLEFDADGSTLGIDPRYTADCQLAESDNHPLPVLDDLLSLGTFTVSSVATGESIAFESLNLAAFLNLTAFFEDDDMAGLATIIIEQTNVTSLDASFVSKEGALSLAPQLVLAAMPNAAPEDADFDGDGDVDGNDFLAWQRSFMETGAAATGDANGDGIVDADDLAIWESQFGVAATASAARAVPEPATFTALSLAALTLGVRCRKR